MTPKEKAEELVNKFMNIKNVKLSDYSVIYLPTAKQCALLAVDALLSSLLRWDEYAQTNCEEYYYWQQVKEEIEKL